MICFVAFFLCSPPNGCLQYHTGIDGRFTTFNWGSTPVVQHLRNQDYRICIRQEEGMNTDILKNSNFFLNIWSFFFLGYCCIIYMQCTDANSFTINPGTGGNDMWTMGKIQSNCAEDYIWIEGCILIFLIWKFLWIIENFF